MSKLSLSTFHFGEHKFIKTNRHRVSIVPSPLAGEACPETYMMDAKGNTKSSDESTIIQSLAVVQRRHLDERRTLRLWKKCPGESLPGIRTRCVLSILCWASANCQRKPYITLEEFRMRHEVPPSDPKPNTLQDFHRSDTKIPR